MLRRVDRTTVKLKVLRSFEMPVTASQSKRFNFAENLESLVGCL